MVSQINMASYAKLSNWSDWWYSQYSDWGTNSLTNCLPTCRCEQHTNQSFFEIKQKWFRTYFRCLFLVYEFFTALRVYWVFCTSLSLKARNHTIDTYLIGTRYSVLVPKANVQRSRESQDSSMESFALFCIQKRPRYTRFHLSSNLVGII